MLVLFYKKGVFHDKNRVKMQKKRNKCKNYNITFALFRVFVVKFTLNILATPYYINNV